MASLHEPPSSQHAQEEVSTDEDVLLSSSRKQKKLSSDLKTLGNLLISVVGAGVLGLPFSFMKAGWLCGLVSIFGVAAITYYGMMLLVKSRKMVELRLGSTEVVLNTYGDLAYQVLGKWGQVAADVMIILSQCGFCVAYLIFIGQNVSSVAYGTTTHKTMFILLVAPLQMVFSWLKSLTKLAPFSIVADVVNLLAYGIVFTRDAQAFSGYEGIVAYGGPSAIPFALGVAVYAFEGAGMILPIETNMKKRSHFPGVLALGISLTVAIYSLFGLAGYFGFKDKTMDIITLNLPKHWTTDAVKLGISFSLFFTFPVMMNPVYAIYERPLFSTTWFQEQIEPHKLRSRGLQRLLRALMVLLVVYVAIGVPKFSVFIALIGSSVCSLLGFVLPAVIHVQAGGGDLSWLEKLADCFCILFGLGFGIWGTYSSVCNIFH